jgi:hypothetical protein
MDRFLAPQGEPFDLRKYGRDALLKVVSESLNFRTFLYAEAERSLLIILQALDTGGKDRIMRDVL